MNFGHEFYCHLLLANYDFCSMCSSLNPDNNTLTGKVVLCFDMLDNQNADNAVEVVKAAGGVGLIFARNPGAPIASCEDLPCVEVDFEIGKQLHFYIRSSRLALEASFTLCKNHMRAFSCFCTYLFVDEQRLLVVELAQVSNGEDKPFSNKDRQALPDIAAPGVNIVAAVPSPDPNDSGYGFMSGTSMACPHVAGIVALLKSLHPDWSPGAMKSALVTTASSADESGGPIFAYALPLKIAAPFDFGGGIVNPNKAADPGLIYDMGMEDYVHYLCSRGYPDSDISRVTEKPTVCPSKRPSALDMNLPSIAIPSLKSSVTISRTLTNVGPVKSVYEASIQLSPGIHAVVSPSVLEFNSKAKKLSFTVTFSSAQKVQGGYYFGSLTWSDGVHNVRSPIACLLCVEALRLAEDCLSMQHDPKGT
ncbi:hypothetical protein ACLOJK_030387 [Asimina triloba]